MGPRATGAQLSSFIKSASEHKKQKLREMKHEREINTLRDCQASLTSTHRIDKYQCKYRTPEYREIVGGGLC